MADAAAFEAACQALERRSALDRLQARGTVRLALKQAGLDAQSVTPAQMAVVVEKLLPAELASRGVGDLAAVCDAVHQALRGVQGQAAADTPDTVFARLGGR